MRLALIADIHGNAVALRQTLEEIDRLGIERIVCLGDVAATGPQPHEAVAELRERGIATVMGNADAEILNPPDPDQAEDPMRKYLEMSVWGRGQLTGEDTRFLSECLATIEIDLGESGTLLCVHGSPRSYDEIMRADSAGEALDQMLAGQEATVVAGGHTHIQMLRRHGRRILINPGAVGLAYDPAPPHPETRCVARAEFAVIEIGASGFSCTLHRLAYDPKPLLAIARESGMPHAEWWCSLWE